MEFPAAGNLDSVRAPEILDAQRDIGLRFAFQPRLDLPERSRLPLLPREGPGIDEEEHRNRGFFDVKRRENGLLLRRRKCVPDADIFRTGNPDDVARERLFDLNPVESPGDPNLGRLRFFRACHLESAQGTILVGPLGGCPDKRLSLVNHAVQNLAAADASGIVTPCDRADLHQEGGFEGNIRSRDVFDDRFEERLHSAVAVVLLQIADGPSVKSGAVQNGKIGLFVRRSEFDEQIERLFQGADRIGRRPVDFVHENDRLQSHAKGVHQNVSGLGHRSLVCVDKKQHRIHRRENALDFSGEVCMSGRIDNVDMVVAPRNGAVFGANGDAALPFDLVVIHDPLFDACVRSENLSRPEDRIDERRLAVIDVRDNGDIANPACVLHDFSNSPFPRIKDNASYLSGAQDATAVL